MAMTETAVSQTHPFLDGRPKKMLIDGRWVEAASTTFGLGSGVWTRDVSKAHRLARGIRAGSVWVNCYQAMDPAVPFGGYKMSGYGRESGLQQMEEYLNVKAVWIKTA